MKLLFWGTSGSIPAPITGAEVRKKIFRALQAASGRAFGTDAEIQQFIDEELPFEVSHTYGRNTSCVQIEGEDDGNSIYLLDGGSGIREYSDQLIASGVADTPRTYHIFISHLHWDHVHGFPFFAPAYRPGNKIIFYGIHPEIEEIFSYQMKPPWFPITPDALHAEIRFQVHQPGETLHVDDFVIKTREQNHPGKSCGYRFERDGKIFVYSTDSEHNEHAYRKDYDYLDFIRNADILIFDAQYDLHQATNNKAHWGHSSNIMGVELAARSLVKHLVIFHHEPSNKDDDLGEFLQSTRSFSDIYYAETNPKKQCPQFPEKISLAFDGMQLEF